MRCHGVQRRVQTEAQAPGGVLLLEQAQATQLRMECARYIALEQRNASPPPPKKN